MSARPIPVHVLVLALTLLPAGLSAQSSVRERGDAAAAPSFAGGYWHVVTYELPADRLEGLQEFLRTVAIPVAERMKRVGDLLERRWLVRDFGKDFSYIVMSRWADPEAIWAGRSADAELEATFVDSGRADRARRLAEGVLGGVPYTSVLYREVEVVRSPALATGDDADR